MGRKQRRLCLGLRFLVMIPIFIVLAPAPSSFSWSSYHAMVNSLTGATTAETIATNGVIWTGDSSLPWATSLAISRGRILSVGSLREVQRNAGSETQYVDLGGKFVAPGFVDSHVHFIPSGIKMNYVNMRDVRSRSDFVEKVELLAKVTKKGSWIIGDNWNHHNWGGDLPQASWIDSVTPDNPVWMVRMDGHMGFANSRALAEAGIDTNVPDPEGGIIVKDNEGGLSGVLSESAMALITRILPQPSLADRRDGLLRACTHALSRGITSVVDFGAYIPGVPAEQSWNDLRDVYLWADSKAKLSVRVSAFLPLQTWARLAGRVAEKGRILSQWLRIGGVKAFADGSLGSSSALFHEPYADDPSNHGVFVVDPEWLLKAIIDADKAGLQIAVHVIGDAAVDHLLSVVEIMNATNGPRDRRFRLEHVQHMTTGGPARVASSGVIASVQPMHLLDDAIYVKQKLGEERGAKGSYLFNSLLTNGTILALGSDWNVAPLDALGGIQAAVRRIPKGWTVPFIDSEIIPVEAALKGYTVNAAHAAFMDEDVGSLAVGKLADFVVLSENLLMSTAETMPKVMATYVGGVQVYARDDLADS
ncbi:hypothetical protein MPTK1_2g07090 [Marchantia polymorpha subsp. ruderalis]|uniref:Amidohydrolase 3 domain-containing protein n=1 Tax=Marchantia polymorpha TaxID=3197 RepID=A0A2R6XDY6_MARPO|nr:hypothetical protein MARPO_0021s0162 [Marchantia polymorpha]BBN01396.1 hypothetical protein Mp_2g07090 [Marchantia polymorpha subsp. ruderalis]|eukprot:PTQ44322.1 hypothetical protein MARPO_0021s0162 [Marchantia polymorpha]